MPAPRTSPEGSFFLRLDGVDCGRIPSFEGGALTADVIVTTSRGRFDKKQLGRPRPEEIALRIDLGLEGPFYDWLSESFAGKAARRSGEILALDATGKSRWEREFQDALVTEIGFPALDGASKEAAYLTVKLAPEAVRTKEGSGTSVGSPAKGKKRWLPSNFRLELDGLDCKKVTKIDGFSVTQKVSKEPIEGRPRTPGRQAELRFPDLRVRLGVAQAQSWLDWGNSFIEKGKNSDAEEKTGKIVFLAPDLKAALAEVRLFGVGIFRLDRELPRSATGVALLRADLYCERMELEVF